MGKTQRTFSREFKLEVCRQWMAGERTAAQLMREHRLVQSVLYRWRAEYQAFGTEAFTGQQLPTEQASREAVLVQRISALERALGKATIENQLLKKGRSLAASWNDMP